MNARTAQEPAEITAQDPASRVLLPIRLVSGFMFFSAFHRRVILESDKLVPDAAGYIGEKFNQFMPGAILGVGDLIAFLLDNPAALHAFLWTFTIIEALVGLALMLGLCTRLSAFGVLMLSVGILFGAGWLGPTCLDEWQIGALGIASGATLMLGGGGAYSVDAWLQARYPQLMRRRWAALVASPSPVVSKALVWGLGAFAMFITLATTQVFHGGLWGKLHNDSVKPRVDVLGAGLTSNTELTLTLERPVGPETYGAFVVAVRVLTPDGELLQQYDAGMLRELSAERIQNRWLVQVRPVPHGLVVPLGARATLRLPRAFTSQQLPGGEVVIEVEDVSGARWVQRLELAAEG